MATKAVKLEAMVRDDYRSPSVTAFGGREYVKGSWREVPAGQADSAAAHPYLRVREAGSGDVVEAEESVVEVAPAPSRAAHRGKSK